MEEQAAAFGWQTVFASAGVSLASVTVLWYWLQQRLRQSIEHEYNVLLEELKANLRIDAFREEVKFSKLHERRAEVISETYSLLRQLRNDVRGLLNFPNSGQLDDPATREGLKRIEEALAQFNSYFFPRQIYVPRATADHIANLRLNYFLAVSHAVELQRHPNIEVKSNAWLEGIRKAHNECEVEFDAVETELREALGDTQES